MAVVHMVWFRWKAEASPEQITAALDALAALKAQIPCILELSVGANFTTRAAATHGLLVKLASAGDLTVYSEHPAHLAVVRDHIAPIKEEVTAVDYVEGGF